METNNSAEALVQKVEILVVEWRTNWVDVLVLSRI